MEKPYTGFNLTRWAQDPKFVAYYRRARRRQKIAEVLFGWTRRIPLVGQLVWVFWGNIVREGVHDTVVPRWGALTFSFLNDGVKPTVWHTIYSVTHDNQAPLSGIYTRGAPRNRKEAEEYTIDV